jgi:DNA-binding response OmpR family regulator
MIGGRGMCSPEVEEIDIAKADSGSVTAMPKSSVLICEDESLIRIYLVDMLEELGYNVLESANGGEAIEQMSAGGVDFLITDLGLPDMPGKELVRRLRTRWPRLPVLFATGRGREDADLLDGNIGYLPKPFTMKTLQCAVTDLLARSTVSEI